jgi:hypothetical protein
LEFGLRFNNQFQWANNLVADAHRDDGKRLVARADEKLTAFVELEAATRSRGYDGLS